LIGMTRGRPLDAFRLEAEGFSQAVAGLPEDEWDLSDRVFALVRLSR
jgi:hypothetical protein